MARGLLYGRRMPKLTLTSALLLVAALSSASSPSTVSAIVTSPEAPRYLAHARIWKDPGDLSPQDVLEVRKGSSLSYEHAAAGIDSPSPGPAMIWVEHAQVPCTSGSGRCCSEYWSDAHIHREVFAGSRRARLWALGFTRSRLR